MGIPDSICDSDSGERKGLPPRSPATGRLVQVEAPKHLAAAVVARRRLRGVGDVRGAAHGTDGVQQDQQGAAGHLEAGQGREGESLRHVGAGHAVPADVSGEGLVCAGFGGMYSLVLFRSWWSSGMTRGVYQ